MKWQRGDCGGNIFALIGASSSSNIGCEMKISRALVQRKRISVSRSWTCLPGLLPLTSRSLSMTESRSTSFWSAISCCQWWGMKVNWAIWAQESPWHYSICRGSLKNILKSKTILIDISFLENLRGHRVYGQTRGDTLWVRMYHKVGMSSSVVQTIENKINDHWKCPCDSEEKEKIRIFGTAVFENQAKERISCSRSKI